MELINKCRELVKNNIKDSVDESVIEYIALSIMALKLTLPENITSKLPKILNKLNIYALNKSVLEIAHDELGNYMEDDSLSHADAAVTRSLKIDDEAKTIDEDWNLLISLKKNKQTHEIIGKIIHELVHLLRFNGIKQEGNNIKLLDGISNASITLEPLTVKRKHYYLEEGIVQTYTNMSMRTLYEYSKNIKNPILEEYKKEMKQYNYSDYLLETEIIKLLSSNNNINNLLLESFNEKNMPSSLANYYNRIMDDNTAFTRLSRKLDNVSNSVRDNDIELNFKDLGQEVKLFLSKTKIKKLYL